MRRHIIRYVLLMLMAMTAAEGCRRIPLYDLSTNVRIIIDHELGIDHDIELSTETDLPDEYQVKVDGKMPQYVNVLFYHPETHQLLTSRILDAAGGVVNIPAGNYHIVTYNFGTESTQIASPDYRLSAEAHTSDITRSMLSKLNAIQASVRKETKSDFKGYDKMIIKCIT